MGYRSSESPRNLILFLNLFYYSRRGHGTSKTGSTHNGSYGGRPGNIAAVIACSMPLIAGFSEIPLLGRLSQQHDRTSQRPRFMYSIASDYNDGETFCIRHHHHRGGNTSGDSGTGLWLLSGLVPARSRTLNCPNWTTIVMVPNKSRKTLPRIVVLRSRTGWSTCYLGIFAEWDHTT
jgi:hypothetical protein